MSPSETIPLTGWQIGISTHLIINQHLLIDIGINYVVDGGEKKFINSVSQNETVSLVESLRWIEIPIGFNVYMLQSKLRLGTSLGYRYLLKSTAGLSVTSLADTMYLTRDFTEYRKQSVLFGGLNAGYHLSKRIILEFQFKRNFGTLNDGWDNSLLIQDEPFRLNIFMLRIRYFVLVAKSKSE